MPLAYKIPEKSENQGLVFVEQVHSNFQYKKEKEGVHQEKTRFLKPDAMQNIQDVASHKIFAKNTNSLIN